MKIISLIPYPNRIWGAVLDNGNEIMFSENVLKLPEGDYGLGEQGYSIFFLHDSKPGLVSFVYRDFETDRIKVYEVDIYDDIQKIIDLEQLERESEYYNEFE